MVEAINNQTPLVTGTAVAGAAGAVVGATTELLSQKSILKNPSILDTFEKDLAALKAKEVTGGFAKIWQESKIEAAEKMQAFAKKLLETKKLNWKSIGKVSAVGAVAFGAIYLAYRGIKALFTK